ncbi:MAG: polysaccharide biosynthesis/export family protein [Bacteroidetes bacterium]|nr:polysaccharide biosynthesis/export family protein [Bacteroidota bacterium]
MQIFRLVFSVLSIACLSLFAACSGIKKAKKEMVYLREGNLDTLPNLNVPIKEATIQKEDLLKIVVFSDNPEATAIYNQSSGGADMKLSSAGMSVPAGSSGGSSSGGSYLVDRNGNIRFQTLGLIHVEGLTRLQLMDSLAQLLAPYLKNPYADIRFLNARVTILGEVMKPGVYNITDDKISVLELLGMSGDVTMYARRDNVLVIRQKLGKREFARLDLRKANVFQSPYYYLEQNDIVVVEPTEKKPTATDQETTRRIAMIASVATLASTISILISVFRR